MAGFKTTKRKVTVEREARTVSVSGLREAGEVIHDYANLSVDAFSRKYGVNRHPFCDTAEILALTYAACAVIFKGVATRVSPAQLKELGVEPAVPCAIEPTWTSSDGKTQAISKMPTPYLQSVLRFAANMTERDDRGKPRGQGLVDAITSELDRREEAEEGQD